MAIHEVVVATPAAAIAPAAATAFGEFATAAAVDPDRAIAAAPVAAFLAARIGDLTHQYRVAPAGIADHMAVAVAVAADGLVAVAAAAPATTAIAAAFGKLGAAAAADPDAAVVAAPVAALGAAGIGNLADQHRTAPAGIADLLAVVVAVAADGAVAIAIAVPAAALAATPAAAAFAEFGAAAVADPHIAVAAAPTAALGTLGLR